MNSSDFEPHHVDRGFEDGVPLWDFVFILYRAKTPTNRRSKFFHCFWFRYNHEKNPNRLDRINECLRKVSNKKKPKLRVGYKWGRAQVMRVD